MDACFLLKIDIASLLSYSLFYMYIMLQNISVLASNFRGSKTSKTKTLMYIFYTLCFILISYMHFIAHNWEIAIYNI